MQSFSALGGIRLALMVLVLGTSGCLPVEIVTRSAEIEHVDAKTTKVTLRRYWTIYGITVEGINYTRGPTYTFVVTDADSVYMSGDFEGKTYRLNVSSDSGHLNGSYDYGFISSDCSGHTGIIGYLAISKKEDHVYLDIRYYQPRWEDGLEGFKSYEANGEFEVKKVEEKGQKGKRGSH